MGSLYRNLEAVIKGYTSRHYPGIDLYKRPLLVSKDQVINFEAQVAEEFNNLKDWMHKKVYQGLPTKERDRKARTTISLLFDALYANPKLLEKFNQDKLYGVRLERRNQPLEDFVKNLIVMTGEAHLAQFCRQNIIVSQ